MYFLVCWTLACAPVTPSWERVLFETQRHPGATVRVFQSVAEAERTKEGTAR
jgi:hypothetical protein